MGERDNPISVRSKHRITESLLELMKTEPFGKISIKDIVERAGLTRQTFYHNFTSKEDVLQYRGNELFEEFLAHVEEREIDDWEHVVTFYFRFWQRHAEFLRLLIDQDLIYLMQLQYPSFKELRKSGFMGVFTEAPTAGSLAYSFYSGAIFNLLVTWIEEGMRKSVKEVTDLAMDLLDGTVFDEIRNGEFTEKYGSETV